MTGTDQLHTQDGNGKLAVLLERSEQTKAFMELASANLGKLSDTVVRIEKTQIETVAELRARSEANSTAIKHVNEKIESVDEKVDQEKSTREAAMLERRRAHDDDIAGLRKDIKNVGDKVETLKDKTADAVTLGRITLFVIGALVLAVTTAAITGHLGIVIHP